MTLTRRSFIQKGAGITGALALLTDASAQTFSSDPLGVRNDFPITQKRIHLNAAYTAAIPQQVVDAARAFAEGKAAGPATVGDMLRETGRVRAQYASLIHALPEEIAFLSSTSEGENIIANGIPWSKGDNVVTDDLHYETGFVIFKNLEQTKGVELRIVRNKEGAATASDYAKVVDSKTRLLSLSYVSSLNGYRHDLKALADLAHAKGAYLYVDGIQGVGAFPLDVHATGTDFMCSGSYKWLLSCYGVAPFYIRKDLVEKIPIDRFGWKHVEKELPNGGFELSHTASRFEYATLPFMEISMLGASLSYLEKVGVDRIGQHTLGLARAIRKGIQSQGKRLFTPPDNESPTVTFYFESDPAAVKAAFAAASIDVTVRDKEKQIRVSPALYNTMEEIERFLGVVKGLD